MKYLDSIKIIFREFFPFKNFSLGRVSSIFRPVCVLIFPIPYPYQQHLWKVQVQILLIFQWLDLYNFAVYNPPPIETSILLELSNSYFSSSLHLLDGSCLPLPRFPLHLLQVAVLVQVLHVSTAFSKWMLDLSPSPHFSGDGCLVWSFIQNTAKELVLACIPISLCLFYK